MHLFEKSPSINASSLAVQGPWRLLYFHYLAQILVPGSAPAQRSLPGWNVLGFFDFQARQKIENIQQKHYDKN